MSTNNTYIGRITKTVGLKGEVLLELNSGVQLDYDELSFLLLGENNGAPVPWFVESIAEEKDNLIVKFEDIDTSDAAKKLTGKDVHCDASALIEDEAHYFIGFTVEDEKAGVLGEIKSIEEYPGQLIMSVIHPSGKEILLPLTENFLKTVLKEEKKIIYSAPEGLLDVYL
jgi:16S rRNA processing protein RimM